MPQAFKTDNPPRQASDKAEYIECRRHLGAYPSHFTLRLKGRHRKARSNLTGYLRMGIDGSPTRCPQP